MAQTKEQSSLAAWMPVKTSICRQLTSLADRIDAGPEISDGIGHCIACGDLRAATLKRAQAKFDSANASAKHIAAKVREMVAYLESSPKPMLVAMKLEAIEKALSRVYDRLLSLMDDSQEYSCIHPWCFFCDYVPLNAPKPGTFAIIASIQDELNTSIALSSLLGQQPVLLMGPL